MDIPQLPQILQSKMKLKNVFIQNLKQLLFRPITLK